MSGGRLLKVGARLSKLRMMSAREIAARVRYRAIIEHERRQHHRNTLAPAGRLATALRRDLQSDDWPRALLDARRMTSAKYFAGSRDRERLRALFAAEFRNELAATLEQAQDARCHRFEFFGRRFQYGEQIDWQADPVTGRSWPALYHADVPVHRGDVGCGDVKYVWELSRQQYVIDLGKAWFLADSADDLRAMQRLVESWIRGNPYATGVNWACALEPAFRAWSWLWAYHLTAAALDDRFHLEWLQSFYDHGRFLATHLEHYSSPYNHLIGEASALYALGVCFPEFHDAPAWRRLARSVLETRLREQFYEDGGSVEQSTFYHHATLGFYLLVDVLAQENSETTSPAVRGAIERALTFSLMLTQPDGRTPEIGGADDGKPIRMEHLPFWDFRPYQAVGAVLFGRPDFKAVAGRFFEDALWLLGVDGYERFQALPSMPPGPTSSTFPASGYMVSRSEWSESADYLCFDVGEQAAGMRNDGVPNSMHGHADCLSVIIWLDGRRVLVDSGLYAYNCGGEWEAHFRETAAHNTARIDGRDQARHIGKMAWSHSYRATIENGYADERQSWTIGSHDGYARGPHGVTHRRVVWRRPTGYVLLCDEFVGDGEHAIEVVYQFAPGAITAAGPNHLVFEGFAQLAWIGTTPWTHDIRCGGENPHEGWICSSLGVRQPAPRATLRARMTQTPCRLLTVIADCGKGESRVAAVLDERSGQTLIAIDGDAGIDWVAMGGANGAPIDTDSPVAICAATAESVVERASAGGSYLSIDENALLRLTASRSSVAAR